MLMQTRAKPMGRDAFLRIANHLAEEVEPRSALDAVAEEIAEIIPFTHADVCLDDGRGWVVTYEVGIQTRWSRMRTRVQYSPVRELLLGNCPAMLTSNAMEDPRYVYPGASCEPILNHQMRSRVNVPMRVMGRVLGTLNISHSVEGVYNNATVIEAQILANTLAPYFHALHSKEQAERAAKVGALAAAREEGLRQGALELTQALEQERQRVGMDLHDQTLADLTRLLRDVTGDGASPEVLNERLTYCIEDLRRIIDTAVPTLLELFGFAHAVRVHLERAVGNDPVEISVQDSTSGASDKLGQTTRTALFRIIQETINNAARHSGASQIQVSIRQDADDRLSVCVQDDGRGIGSPVQKMSSGLSHMRTRSNLIGAELDIVEDHGTCIIVRLPKDAT